MNAMNQLSNLEMVIVDRMVKTRMKEIQGEAETIRKLHEAGLVGPGMHERAALAVGRILVRLGQRLQKKHTYSHQEYHTTSDTYPV